MISLPRQTGVPGFGRNIARGWRATRKLVEIGDLRDYFGGATHRHLFENAPKPHGALAEKAAGLFTDQIKKQATRVAKTR